MTLALPGFESYVDAPAPPAGVKLRDYQREQVDAVIAGWAKGENVLLQAATGCHAKGQGILMFDGSIKKVEDVLIGDQLMGPDGFPRIVLRLCRGEEEMVDVVPTKGSTWRVNRSHILTLVRTAQGRGRPGGDVVDVCVLDYDHWGRTAKHVHKLFRMPVVRFGGSRAPLQIEPYMLGLWLGDGTHDLSCFQITKPDPEVREYVHAFAAANGATVRAAEGSGKCPSYTLRTRGTKLMGALRGLFAGKPLHIPHDYKTGSWGERSHVLAGLLDSDGHLTCGGFDFISKSRQLSDDVAFVARSLGFAAYVSRCEKGCQGGHRGEYWRVSLSGDFSTLPLRIARKVAPKRRQKKSVLRTGFQLKPTGAVESYYGFTLSGDGRFLLDDFTVTHNTGKTTTLSAVVKDCPTERFLVLAHRDEIIDQLIGRLELVTGERVDREQAQWFAAMTSRIVVASVATLNKKRLARFGAGHFTRIIVDEAHHAVAPTYRRVFDHFSGALRLGVTATPDRTDGSALGQVFDSCVHRFDILKAISCGVLVPIVARSIRVDVDFSKLKARKDYSDSQLDEVLGDEQHINAVVRPTIELAGSRSTIVFTTGVQTAHRMAEVFNEIEPDSARAVDGSTPFTERRMIMEGFRSGRFRRLINFGIATEGFDAPVASCVVVGRPTKSRSLYTQMIGRGLRTFDGKRDCLILDVAGNAGKHDLSCKPEDILGGDYEPKVRELAQEIREAKPETPVLSAIKMARDELARRKKSAMETRYREVPWDPFVACGLKLDSENYLDRRNGFQPTTQEQRDWLVAKGLYPNHAAIPKTLSARTVQKMRWDAHKRFKDGLATYKQMAVLSGFGIVSKDVTFARAHEALDYVFKTPKHARDARKVHEIVFGARQAGEEG